MLMQSGAQSQSGAYCWVTGKRNNAAAQENDGDGTNTTGIWHSISFEYRDLDIKFRLLTALQLWVARGAVDGRLTPGRRCRQ